MILRFSILLMSIFSLCNASWSNFVGNQTCSPSCVVEPKNLEELQSSIRKAAAEGQKICIAGAGYSLSSLIDTGDCLVSCKNLNRILAVDINSSTVYVEAGITLRELNDQLAQYGLAISNQASIDDLTLGGAIATASHGTGKTGTLSSFVEEIDLVASDGIVHKLSSRSDPEAFRAARVSLGALGAIYAVKLRCEPLFYLSTSEEEVDIPDLMLNYQKLYEENDFFQFSLNFATNKSVVTRKNRSSGEVCYKSLACYQITEEDKNYLFSEVAVAAKLLPQAIATISSFVIKHQKNGMDIEDVLVRFAEADQVSLLSPAADRSVAYLTMSVCNNAQTLTMLKEFEDILVKLGGRPHWGKIHFLDRNKAQQLYGINLEKFLEVKKRLDPHGVFSNPFIERLFSIRNLGKTTFFLS